MFYVCQIFFYPEENLTAYAPLLIQHSGTSIYALNYNYKKAKSPMEWRLCYKFHR